MSDLDAYIHQPLVDPAKQIRLLHFSLHEQEGAPIRFTILHHDLAETPIYNAISYRWGQGPPDQRIAVDGRLIAIGTNCHYAIKQALEQDRDAPIWIDSICINQSDLDKKSAQVTVMGELQQRIESLCLRRTTHRKQSTVGACSA